MEILKVIKIYNGKYYLQDIQRNEYQININFYDINFKLEANDIIYISNKLLKEKILCFGILDSSYEIKNIGVEDIILIKHKKNKIYLNRIYG